jgi:hypothetical protein
LNSSIDVDEAMKNMGWGVMMAVRLNPSQLQIAVGGSGSRGGGGGSAQ